MAQFTKFRFLHDFGAPDAAPPEGREVAAAAPATCTDEELQGVREHAYQTGLAAGRAEALADTEVRLCELLDGVRDRVQVLADGLADGQARLNGDVVRLARAIAAKVAGAPAVGDKLGLIEATARDCLAKLYGVPEVTLRVAPSLAEPLRERLVATALPLSLTVAGDERLQGADCRIDWQDGGASRLNEDIWQAVDEVLARYAAMPAVEADAPAQDETRSQTGDQDGRR